MGAGAALASAAVDEPVEVGGLLREDQPRACARGLELHRRQRHRDALAVDMHAVAEDDPPARHDVPVARIVIGGSAAREDARKTLASTDPEIQLAERRLPLRRPDEPMRL